MHFFAHQDVKQGDRYPEAWLAFGKERSTGAVYLSIALPLPQLKGKQSYDRHAVKFGWHVPRIIITDHPLMKLQIWWGWEYLAHFMGEERYDIYDFLGRLLNCPKCHGHKLSRRYEGNYEDYANFKTIIECERCKHEYPQPT